MLISYGSDLRMMAMKSLNECYIYKLQLGYNSNEYII